MLRLRIRQLAQAREITLYRLQLETGLGETSLRRYYWGTKDGREDGEPLTQISLDTLEKIAGVLKAEIGDMFELRPGDPVERKPKKPRPGKYKSRQRNTDGSS